MQPEASQAGDLGATTTADDLTGTTIRRRALLGLAVAAPMVGLLGRAAGVAAALAPQAAPPPGASSFLAIAPNRIADTRAEFGSFGFTQIDANTIRVQVAGQGGVPANATAAVLNVTMTNPTGAGFVSIYPAQTPRVDASSINVERPGQILANLVTVRLSATGQVDMFCYRPADLVVDVNGAYLPTTTPVQAGRYVGLDQSLRALDTRLTGAKVLGGSTPRRVDLSNMVPAGASAVVVNITVTETNGPGFWTAFVPGTTRPTSSTVNTDDAGQTRANQAILPIGVLRAIDVFSYSGGHLIVDVIGSFTGSTSPADITGLFVPNAPYRAIDTRNLPATYGRMYPGWVCELDFAGRAGAQAAVINLTTSETRGPGFFTAYAAGTDRPNPASNLNATTADQTIANHAIARTSNRGIAVYTYGGGDVIVDVAGYFVGTPLNAKYSPVINVVPPPPPPSPLPYTIQIPSLGINDTIVEGVGDNVVDAGFVGHWPGTGLAGEDDHMVLFAHRTEHGGIFRYLHLLAPGDQVIITGADGKTFVYGYWNRAITNSNGTNIFNAGLTAPLPSMSLVACSKTNYQPTDIRYRIIVTFTQISPS